MTAKKTALESFIARKAEIDNALARLKAESDRYFGVEPKLVNWSDVGMVADVAEQLKMLTDVVFQEGEYAESD